MSGGVIQLDGKHVNIDSLERMAIAFSSNKLPAKIIYRHQSWGLIAQVRKFTPEDTFESQPFCDAQKRYWIVADLRIDNRDDLINKLSISSAESKKTPDSQLLLKSFLRWGKDCVQHIVGDFAFIVWDNLEKTIFAACDPTARNTLLYSKKGDALFISTIYSGLHTLPTISRELDDISVADFMSLRPMRLGTTLYKEISRIPPGHYLWADKNTWRISRYCNFDSAPDIRYKSDAEYKDAFLDLYRAVVRAHLRAKGDIGITMSGGLDSSSVGAMAALELKKCGRSLTSFTMIHPHSFQEGVDINLINNEYQYVKSISDFCGNIKPVFLDCKESSFMNAINTSFDFIGVPSNSLTHIRRMNSFYPEILSRGIQVILNGNMGNCTISYDGKNFLPNLFLRGKWFDLHSCLKSFQPLTGFSYLRLFYLFVFKEVFGVDLMKYVKPKNKPWLDRFGLVDRLARQVNSTNGLNFFNRLTTVCNPKMPYPDPTRSSLVFNAMDEWCAVKNQIGIDERDPTGDIRLVRFCMGLPREQFLRKGINRFLIRNAMTGLLPEDVRLRTYFGPREPGYEEHIKQAVDAMLPFLGTGDFDNEASQYLDREGLLSLAEVPLSEQKNTTYLAARRAMRGVQLERFIRWVNGSN